MALIEKIKTVIFMMQCTECTNMFTSVLPKEEYNDSEVKISQCPNCDAIVTRIMTDKIY